MHLTDLQKGILGSFAIVGAGLPVAAGAAWAAKFRHRNQIVVAYFGDGAANIGAFHETLNIASVWKLPVLFVCENNLYGEYSPISTTTPIENIATRAASYAMPNEIVDGNQVLDVFRAAKRGMNRARSGEGPTLLEMKTYRQKGHSRGDPGSYRSQQEVDSWLQRDPILMWTERLEELGFIDSDQISDLWQEAVDTVDSATARALDGPTPDLEELRSDVFI